MTNQLAECTLIGDAYERCGESSKEGISLTYLSLQKFRLKVMFKKVTNESKSSKNFYYRFRFVLGGHTEARAFS